MKLSVLICAHNPRRDYLARVLQALKEQDLPYSEWELLLIDNASRVPLAGSCDLSWHPHARCIVETEVGLTPARLRGIKESKGELLVFVDDDNVLAPDYLAESEAISKRYVFLGAWGAAVIEPEFEIRPPLWIHNYFYLIGIRNVATSRWSNLTDSDITLPCGAGLCVRNEVARVYSNTAAKDSLRRSLDRIGNGLGCMGDLDLALTAVDLGMGTGLFPVLKMKHLMPAARTQERYLLKLAEGNSYSGLILAASRRRLPEIPSLSALRRVFGKARRFLTMKPRPRRFLEASIRGQQRALKDIQFLNSEKGTD